MDNKGQVSTEMILVLAAVVAIALILIQNLSSTAEQAAGKLNSTTTKLLDEIDRIVK